MSAFSSRPAACRTTLVVWVLLGLLGGGAGFAEDGGPEQAVRVRYLKDRDAEALVAAVPAAHPTGWLAARAAGQPPPAGFDASTPRAEASVVPTLIALGADDLPAARRASSRADQSSRAIDVRYVGALVRARGGDAAGAMGRLMAPPVYQGTGDAFALALLGAAAEAEDLAVLGDVLRRSVERAAARGRNAAVRALAEAALALRPPGLDRILVRALRALRRVEAIDEAKGLLQSLRDASGVPTSVLLATERAWSASQSGAREEVAQRLAERQGGRTRLDLTPLVEWLPALRESMVLLDTSPSPHREGDASAHALVARYATLLGRTTHAPDVRAALRAQDAVGVHAAVPRGLAALGFRVAVVPASSPAVTARLARRTPCLVLEPRRVGGMHVLHPVLLRMTSADGRLVRVEDPNVGFMDLRTMASVRKGLAVLAVPLVDQTSLQRSLAADDVRASERLMAALEADDDLAAAKLAQTVRGAELFVGWSLHRHAVLHRDVTFLRESGAWMVRSAQEGERLRLEAEVLGEVALLDRRTEEAASWFLEAEQRGPPSTRIATARFGALRNLRRHDDATRALTEAVEASPVDPELRFLRATWFVQRGDPDAARGDLVRALELRPDSVPYTVFLAHLELDQRRPEAARAALLELRRHDADAAETPQVRTAWRAVDLERMRLAPDVEALRNFRRSPDADTRRRLAYALAMRREPEAEGLLRTLLADDDPGVRRTTLRLYLRDWLRLRMEEDPVLVREIIQVMTSDPDPGPRTAAASLLGRVQGGVVSRALVSALSGPESESHPSVRVALAQALAQHEGRASLQALVAVLADPSRDVRRAALDSLFRLTGERHGFEPEADAEDRKAALERWKRWLDGS